MTYLTDSDQIDGIPELRDRVVSRAKSAYSYVNRQLKRLPPWAPWAIGGAAAVGVLLLVTRKASASSGGASMDVPGGEFERLVAKNGFDMKVLKAIIKAESRGAAFSTPGKPILRFEPYLFKREYKRVTKKDFTGDVPFHPGMANATYAEGRKRTGGQTSEWEVFGRAAAINRDAAIRSSSWGMPQIMGFNYKLLGYKTPVEMVEAFSRSEEAQKVGMINFLINSGLTQAVKNREWEKIGRGYNGDTTGYYGRVIESHYNKMA